MVDHLAGLGHRRIGHVAGPAGNVLSIARLAGFRDRMRDRGLALDEDWIWRATSRWIPGRRRRRNGWPCRPTGVSVAVFLASDAMACGFIAEVQRCGLAVPRDLSVIGFDDIELVGHIWPPLTTIRQPRAMIGRAAAERLLRRLETRDAEDDDTIRRFN